MNAFDSFRKSLLARIAGVASLAMVALPAAADVTFDFETSASMNSALVSGNKFNFVTTTTQSHAGSQSIHFADPAPEAYENFTYDIPMDNFTSGVVSVWFYDSRGLYNTGHGIPQVGGSIILEDSNNPQDFVAVEICSMPYPYSAAAAYYASEGSVDRMVQGDWFDYLATRSIGFHKAEFHVTPTNTQVFVDGVKASQVAGPGSTATLRLRFMNDSPSNGGEGAENWVTTPRTTSWGLANSNWVFFDDIKISQELPTVEVHDQGFEIVSGSATYDTAGEVASPGGPGFPANDNPYMEDFVNQWNVTTTASVVHSGSQAAYFANATPPFRGITFDLPTVSSEANASTVTVWFYDAQGQNSDFDKNNSILLESVADKSVFMGVEINNWPYPFGSPGFNYYAVESLSNNSSAFWSRSLPARSIGWHKVEFGLYPTYTTLYVDGAIAHRNNTANILYGPGASTPMRLRLMADGASQGGGGNWVTDTPLDALYQISTAPYVYYDDITIPGNPPASVGDWQMY